MSDDFKELIPLIIALLAWVPGIWGAVTAARKEKAESGALVTQALDKIYKPLLARVDQLEAENKALKAENDTLKQEAKGLRHLMAVLLDGVRRLVHQVRSIAGAGDPVFDLAGVNVGDVEDLEDGAANGHG